MLKMFGGKGYNINSPKVYPKAKNVLERIDEYMAMGMSEEEACRLINFEDGGEYNE